MLTESSDEILKLEVDTPFKQFVLMEMERERLYRSFIDIDELNEISKIWVEFSNFCASSLFNVASLSNLLYQRYLDEWKRDKEQIEANQRRKEIIVSKIENLQEFQMELAMLMNLYSDIVNSGIFNIPSEYFSPEYFEAFLILNRITNTYFDSTHPRASSIEEIMLSFLMMNQKEHIIRLLEQDERLQKRLSLLEEKSNYELTLSEFDSIFSARLLKYLGKEWWWHDPIALHFAYDRSLKHLEKVEDLIKEGLNDPEKLQEIEKERKPLIKAKKNMALVEHYFRLIYVAAKANNFKAALEYLNIVIGLIEEAREYVISCPNSEKHSDFKEEIEAKLEFATSLHKIAEIALEFFIITLDALEADSKGFIKEVESLLNKIEETSFPKGINYVAYIPLIYLNCLQQMKIALLEKRKPYEAIKASEKNLMLFINQLIIAIKGIMTKLEKVIERNKEDDILIMENILKDLEYLKLAFYFLPESSEKENGIKEVEVLEFLVKSYLVEKKVASVAKKINEVLILIYHAKAYYYATKALEIAQKSQLKFISHSWVEKRYSEAFIKGIDIELQLFGLTRQYLFLNVVIDKFVQSFKFATENKDPNYDKVIQTMFEKFEFFEKLTKRIADDCNELLNHKELFTHITENINWRAIEGKKRFALSLVEYLRATELAILAYGAHNRGDNYKAISYFNEAAKLALNITEILKPLATANEEIANIANQSYEYNLFLKELERNVRENVKLKEFPFTKVLELMKRLAFV